MIRKKIQNANENKPIAVWFYEIINIWTLDRRWKVFGPFRPHESNGKTRINGLTHLPSLFAQNRMATRNGRRKPLLGEIPENWNETQASFNSFSFSTHSLTRTWLDATTTHLLVFTLCCCCLYLQFGRWTLDREHEWYKWCFRIPSAEANIPGKRYPPPSSRGDNVLPFAP